MPRMSHHFVTDRPIDAVFNVVTTARFWPEWHPATRGVAGDVGQPARLGDQIIEHVTIAGIQGSGTWTVVEHDRPHHLALETDLAAGHLRISYQLTTVGAGRTRFQRDLDFPDLGPQVSTVMEAQSAEGIGRLARLVQRQVPAPGAATIDELIAVMEDMQARLDADGDGAGTGTASTAAAPSPSATRSTAAASSTPHGSRNGTWSSPASIWRPWTAGIAGRPRPGPGRSLSRRPGTPPSRHCGTYCWDSTCTSTSISPRP